MRFSKVKAVRIPKGSARRIRHDGKTLWVPILSRYVSLGDSIACGYEINGDWAEDYGTGSEYGENGNTETAIVPDTYTDLIRKELIAQYGNAVNVTSFAHSGDEVADLIEKLDHNEVKTAIKHADYVTVCIGANDVLQPALSNLDGYFNNGSPTLDVISQQVEANLAILRDDSNANSYRALLDKLYALNPNATYVFTNVYNPVKYLWLDESTEMYDYKDGFFGPLMWSIPDTSLGAISNQTRAALLDTNVVQTLFDRINGPSRDGSDGIAAWAEKYVNKLNEVIASKIAAFGKQNFKMVDTKLLFEAFPDRPVTAYKNYNDLVNIEFTRGYVVQDMDWSKFWSNIGDITSNPEGVMSGVIYSIVNNVILPDIDPHPEAYGHYAMKRAFADAFGWESLSRYSLAYNAGSGTGSMASKTLLGIDNLPAFTTLDANAFVSPSSGRYFGSWNTSADGSGTSYEDKQVIGITSDITLYAQWAGEFTINYYKIYNCDWEDVYPPASNSGPVAKDGSEYYLRVTVNGSVLPGLGDYFTESGSLGLVKSPTRSIVVPADSELYIQLINKGEYDRGAVYINDQKVAGNSEYCYYTMKVTKDMTMTFTWETENTVIYEPQSYWICRIYTN